MRVSRNIAGIMGVAAIAAFCALSPAMSATSSADSMRAKARSVSLNAPGSLGSFTPAANPRMAAMLSRGGVSGNGFRFTPSIAPGARRAVTVAVRARGADANRTHAGSQSTAVAMAQNGAGMIPVATAYNLGASVGWKRLMVSGEMARVDAGPLFGERSAADVGVSYAGKGWSTKFELSADRGKSNNRLIGSDESVALDVGGSYRIARNLDVTGGVRYKVQRDRLDPLLDNRRDSQAVYVGTAFRF